MAREKTLAKKEPEEVERLEPYDTFQDMERMFRNFFMTPFGSRAPRFLRELRREFSPDVDIRETGKEYVLSATIPGMEKDDLDIDVTDDTITISGERREKEEEPEEKYHLRTQTYGKFHVSYTLPTPVKPGDVKATYKNGVLEVEMPKTEVREAHKVKVEEGK